MSEALARALALLSDGTLSIDADGRIWRHKKNGRPCGTRRAENVSSKDYLRLTLQIGGRLRSVMAHRVVWTHLHGSIPDELEVNHKNLNKQDNHPDNLELLTGPENIQHSYSNGRKRPWSDAATWRDGKKRLTPEAIESIRFMRAGGALLREVAQSFGISITHVQRLCA